MKICFLNGPRQDETFELLEQGVNIGRETDNTISVLMGGLSRYHARIEKSGSDWVVKDNGSTNGTKVNNRVISAPHTLKDGDVITMGDLSIRFGAEEKKLSTREILTFSDGVVTPKPPPEPLVGPGHPPRHEPPAEEPPEIKFNVSPAASKMDDGGQGQILFKPEPIPFDFTPASDTIPDVGEEMKKQEPVAPPAQPPKIEPQAPQDMSGDIFKPKEEEKEAANHHTLLGKIDFFGKKNAKTDASEGGADGKKKHAGFLFYALVLGLAVIFVCFFIITQFEAEKKKDAAAQAPAQAKKQTPFVLVYEKQVSTTDNIFRFSLTVEQGNATFALDDLKSERHYTKTVKNANKAYLDMLLDKIKATNFMTLQQDAPGTSADNTRNERRLLIAYDDNLNEISVKNTYAQSSFEEIEGAVDEFAENYGMRTISLTPAEMKLEADKAFGKAEQLFMNYEAKPENLREAVARYKITIDMLDQFAPKPEKWAVARQKMQQAQDILDKKVKDLKFDYKRNMELKEYAKAKDTITSIMETVSPESKDYEIARNEKIKLEKLLRQKERK